MRRVATTVCAFLILGLDLLPILASAQEDGRAPSVDAQKLLGRAFDNLYAEDYVQTMRLSTSLRGGKALERRLQITRLQSEKPGKAVVRFLDPAEIRRTSILILEREGSSDDLYVYLPALRRTRHLSSSQRADSFFGTDLSYEDVEPKHADDYVARFEQWSELDGVECAIVDIQSGPEFVSTYESMRSCIEPERAIILWTDFFRAGTAVKRLEIDPKDIREIGERFIPFAITMMTPKRKTETRITTERYELSVSLPDSVFSTVNLEAGDARRDRSRSLAD